MRLRLFFRRLTVSAPRMSVRSNLPWPLRWVAFAIVFGFCASISLWAFEFGKEIAGLDKGVKQELEKSQQLNAALEAEVLQMKRERDQAQSISNTAGTVMTSERAAQEKLVEQIKLLTADNQGLKDDLGFFEKLIPSTGTEKISIRALQAEFRSHREIKWQVLVIQAAKNSPEFSGRLEVSLSGLQNGKPWTGLVPSGPQAIKIKQYGRFDGVYEIPVQVVVKEITTKVLDGSVIKAVKTLKM
jgi:hypothetical protein